MSMTIKYISFHEYDVQSESGSFDFHIHKTDYNQWNIDCFVTPTHPLMQNNDKEHLESHAFETLEECFKFIHENYS